MCKQCNEERIKKLKDELSNAIKVRKNTWNHMYAGQLNNRIYHLEKEVRDLERGDDVINVTR